MNSQDGQQNVFTRLTKNIMFLSWLSQEKDWDMDWMKYNANTLPYKMVKECGSPKETFSRLSNWNPTLRVGSLKVSQIFASRFGGQNLVQTIDFFLKSTTIKLGCIFKIKFYNTNCVHLKGQEPKCENDFWPFNSCKLLRNSLLWKKLICGWEGFCNAYKFALQNFQIWMWNGKVMNIWYHFFIWYWILYPYM